MLLQISNNPLSALKCEAGFASSLKRPSFFSKNITTKIRVSFFFKINLFILFIYFWLCWVFVAARGLSLVAVSGGYSLLRCAGFSLRRLLLLWSTGSRRAGFSSCGHGLSCSAACGIFPDQGSNPCSLHWQVDSNHCATREVQN